MSNVGKRQGDSVMDRDFFVISGIRNKIERNREMQTKIKGVAVAIIFVVVIWSVLSTMKETKISLWWLSLVAVVVLFFVDAYYVKKNEEYEYEIYRLEVERLERKKEIAQIRGEVLTEEEKNQYVKLPAKITLPINYYIVLLILDLLILLLVIR